MSVEHLVEWELTRDNRSTRRKSAPVPLYLPQIQHDLTWGRTRAAAVGNRRLIAWAMARPFCRGYVCPSVCDLVLVPGHIQIFCPISETIFVMVQILNRIDQLWAPLSLLSSAYRMLLPHGENGRGVKLTTHFHLVPRSGIVEQYLHSPIPLHGVVTD
jgi:hypothetical protein